MQVPARFTVDTTLVSTVKQYLYQRESGNLQAGRLQASGYGRAVYAGFLPDCCRLYMQNRNASIRIMPISSETTAFFTNAAMT